MCSGGLHVCGKQAGCVLDACVCKCKCECGFCAVKLELEFDIYFYKGLKPG